MYWLLAFLALGFLIVVHEAGHYIVARWCKMNVARFSIGFGPAIVSWVSRKTGTVFQLSPVPFGGYVEIKGMNIAEDVDPDDKHAYPNRPVVQRMATIFAGPATNYLSAVVLAFALYSCHGMRSTERWWGVSSTKEGYDAHGKLQPGDRILAINGQPVWLHSPEGKLISVTSMVNRFPGESVVVTVQRQGKSEEVSIAPRLTAGFAQLPRYVLGVGLAEQADLVEVGIGAAAIEALAYPVAQTRVIADGLWKIVTGKEKAEVTSVVGISHEFKKAFEAGWVMGIQLLMLLSVYIGLFNLFPLPALDGGRLVFLGYELVTRRRANPRIEATVHMVGIVLLIVAMVLVTYKDCSRLIAG